MIANFESGNRDERFLKYRQSSKSAHFVPLGISKIRNILCQRNLIISNIEQRIFASEYICIEGNMKSAFFIYDYTFWLIYSFIVNFVRINPTPRKNAIALVSFLAMLNISWCTYFILAYVNGPKWLYMLSIVYKLLIMFIPLVVFWVVFSLRYTSSRCEILCERYSSLQFPIKFIISIFVLIYIIVSICLSFGEIGFDHMPYVSRR